jgi:hypothetical protein
MALTSSKASSIFTPEGNSLAVFIDVVDGNLKVKDVFGGVEFLGALFSEDVIRVSKIAFNTNYASTTLEEGELTWNAVDGTLDLRMGRGGATQQIGQEMYYPPVVNKSGVDLIEGTLVMVDPTDVAQGNRIRVVKTISNGTYPAILIVGVLTEPIAKNQEGFATWFGYVRDLDLNALEPSGETWVEGNILYPNPLVNGGLTNIRPEAPNLDSTICAITSINGNNLTVLVRPQLGFTLGELNDVKDSGSTDGQVIMKTSLGIWENKDLYGTPIASVGTASTHKIPVEINGTTYYLLATDS